MTNLSSAMYQLRWVLVEGRLCRVSEFEEIPPKERPIAHCPVCERQVTLKLGKKKVHHFAHRPEDICATTQSETALHLNCKFHIYEQLQKATEVYTNTRCKRCGKPKSTLWKSNWDAVEVEYRIESIRPDIALLNDGAVIGAIEIFVTHAVGPEKAQFLNSQNMDWIEIRGNPGIYEEPDAWSPAKALDVYKQYPAPPTWTCPECEKNQKIEEYRRNHPVRISFARIVDLYYPSGKKYRHVFYVKQALSYDEITKIWIENEKRQIIATEIAPITDEKRQRLNEIFKRKMNELEQKAAVVDAEMKWRRWSPGQKFSPRDFDHFPFRYLWDQNKKRWILQPQLKWKKLG